MSGHRDGHSQGQNQPHNLSSPVWLSSTEGQHYAVSTCYDQGGTTASGQQAHFGEVANDFLALGTRIMLDQPAFGRRVFTVLDRIGHGSELDIFYPSEASCLQYGRRRVGFRVLK